MDLMTALQISASGLSAQRTRVNVHSSNLANANSTRAEDGQGPYRKKIVIFEETPFEEKLTSELKEKASAVKVAEIAEDESPPRKVYEPGNPGADKDGYVYYPNISVIQEMVDLLSAARSYEANVTAMKAAREMIQSSMSISQ